MKTMTSAKENMALLSQEQLTQAAFGTLCQAFALRLLERAGYEDGLYQQVALEFLEEGQESPRPVQNVFHIDLSIVLESLRREAEENKREKKAAEKLLTQILQLRQQGPNDAKAPGTRAEQRLLSLELYPTTIWQQTVYAQALLQNGAARPGVSVETRRLVDRRDQRSNTAAAGTEARGSAMQTPTQALLAWRRSHWRGEETFERGRPFIQRTQRSPTAARVVSSPDRHNTEQANDAQTPDVEWGLSAERGKTILPEALIHRTEQEAAGRQRTASDDQRLAQVVSDAVDRAVRQHQAETGQDAHSAAEQPNASGQAARKEARSEGQEETSNFSDRRQLEPGTNRMEQRGGIPVGRDIQITKPSPVDAQGEKPEAFAERVLPEQPAPESLEFLVQNTGSATGAGEDRSPAHSDARKPAGSGTGPRTTGQTAGPAESNIPTANRDMRMIRNKANPDGAGRAAQPAVQETYARNREELTLWADKESEQTTDTAVHAAVCGNDHIEQSDHTGVQTVEKQGTPPASRADSAENGRDETVSGQAVLKNGRQGTARLNRDIRLTHSETQADTVENAGLAQPSPREVTSLEELTFRTNEEPIKPQGSVPGQIVRGTDQQNMTPVNQDIRLVHSDRNMKEKAGEAQPARLETYGPEELLTYREEGRKGGEEQAVQNNLLPAARHISASPLQPNGQPGTSVVPPVRRTTAEEAEQAGQTRRMTDNPQPEELTHRAEREGHIGTTQAMDRGGKGIQTVGPMTETRTAREIRTIPLTWEAEPPATLRENPEKGERNEVRSQLQGVPNASAPEGDWAPSELAHRTEQAADGANQPGTAQPRESLRSAADQHKTAAQMRSSGALTQTSDTGSPMRRSADRTGGVQTVFCPLPTAQRMMGTRSTLGAASHEASVFPEHNSRIPTSDGNGSSAPGSISPQEDLNYAAAPGEIMRGSDPFSHAGVRTSAVMSWNAPSTDKALEQKSTAAPWPEQVELSYLPGQQTSEQARSTPEPAASMDSEYVRSLPAWAQNFLKGSTTGTEPTGANAPMGVARSISALPGMGSGQDQISWTAPQVQTRPAEITYKQKEEPRSNAAQTARMSDSELRRTADKVYQMIEERIRRERRRLGL